MKQVFNSGGNIIIAEIPAPTCGDNEVLVQNMFSLISAGTESSSLKQGGKGIIGLASKAISNPELIQKAIAMARKEGLEKTLNVIRGQAEERLAPLGYSSSGMVLTVGWKSMAGCYVRGCLIEGMS